jgi:sulfotransferase
MTQTIHFISGLPRAGSTLLCNILAQNPRFHATHTSGCLEVLFGIRNQWDQFAEHQAHPDEAARLRVLQAVLGAYYGEDARPVVFDKSRGWLAHLEMAEQLLTRRAKVLVPVRNIPDVLASLETLHRETAKTRQPPGEAKNYYLFQSVAGRCEYWCRADQMVGLARARILDALQRGFADRMHLVRFERLTEDPRETLRAIYAFLGEPPFEHDFQHVEQVTSEDDAVHGYVNLHVIRPRVTPVVSRAVELLGEGLVRRYAPLSLL